MQIPGARRSIDRPRGEEADHHPALASIGSGEEDEEEQ